MHAHYLLLPPAWRPPAWRPPAPAAPVGLWVSPPALLAAQVRLARLYAGLGVTAAPAPLDPTPAADLAGAQADMVRVRIPPRSSWSGSSTGALQGYFEAVTAGSPVPVVIIHQPKPPTGAPCVPRSCCSFPR